MPYSIHSNELTDRLTRCVEQYVPQWDKIVSRAKQQRPIKCAEKQAVMDSFRESYLQLALEDAVNQLHAKSRVNLRAVPHTSTEHYVVKDTKQGKHAIWTSRTHFVPFNVIALVDQLPVVFDIGIEGPVYNNAQKSWKICPLVKEKCRVGIGNLAHPLYELFNTNEFGYVLMLSRENDQPTSDALMQFNEQGGSLGFFPFFASQFYSDAMTIARAHGLVEPKESNTPKTADML